MVRLKWLLIGFILAGATLLGLWLWWTLVHSSALAIGTRLSDAIQEKLHARPTVMLEKYVVVEEKRPIAELALVSRVTDVEHRMQSDLLFSQARLVVRAAFNVKAGFDLRSPAFALRLDSTLKKARLELPRPRVLSLEMTQYAIVEDQEGWWNRISGADRELGMRQMQADAKLESIRAGILADCKTEIEKDLAGIAQRTGVTVEIQYVQPTTSNPSDSTGEPAPTILTPSPGLISPTEPSPPR